MVGKPGTSMLTYHGLRTRLTDRAYAKSHGYPWAPSGQSLSKPKARIALNLRTKQQVILSVTLRFGDNVHPDLCVIRKLAWCLRFPIITEFCALLFSVMWIENGASVHECGAYWVNRRVWRLRVKRSAQVQTESATCCGTATE